MVTERTEVLIVGAGPAGLAAAVALKRLGIAAVKVVDREPEAGGVPRMCHHTGFGLRDLRGIYSGPAYARHYVRQAERAGIDFQPHTSITGWQGPTRLAYTSPHGLGQIEAQAVVLATGCRERPRAARLVPGSRPQGIFTTGSLQRFVYEHHLPVGRRAVIVGAEIVSLSAVMTLAHARIAIARMVTEQRGHQIYLPYLPMKWYLMDLLTRVPITSRVRLSGIFGQKRVEGVEIAHVETGTTEMIACDTVVFTGDWIPEHELARLGGLAMDRGTGGPQSDALFRTSARGVFAVGNLLHGAETAEVSALEGQRAAPGIASFLRSGAWPQGPRLPLQVEPPLEWIYPNTIAGLDDRPPFGHFTFRVRDFYPRRRVVVCQGARRLHAQAYSGLRPNDSMVLSSDWVKTADPQGETIRVRVET